MYLYANPFKYTYNVFSKIKVYIEKGKHNGKAREKTFCGLFFLFLFGNIGNDQRLIIAKFCTVSKYCDIFYK